MCVKSLFIGWRRLPGNSRLLVVRFWGNQSCMQVFDCMGGGLALLTAVPFEGPLLLPGGGGQVWCPESRTKPT